MTLYNVETGSNLILLCSAILFPIIYIIMRLTPQYFSSFFGECVANNKTSKFHLPMVRGLGIIFPIVLILSSALLGSLLSDIEIIIITISTFIGFWDDKYGLRQKRKLVFFICLGFIWSFSQINSTNMDVSFFINLIFYNFTFVFFVLLFNQIDGINGLATSTFLVCILFIYIIGVNLILLMPLIITLVAYLMINMSGKVGIQGDSGSFFIGSLAAVMLTKTIELERSGIIFFTLGPIIFDVCATTMVRIYNKVDLSIGHRNNLYQKLVARYQSHFRVTFIFFITQIIFCLFLTYLLKINSLIYLYSILFLVGALFILLFCILAYFIHKNKILK